MVRPLLALWLLLSSFQGLSQGISQATSCDVYIDPAPINRTTTTGEENIINGNYQGLAQQYNGVSGQIHAVKFFARVNPAAAISSNTVKVIVYNANLGLPGTIIGSHNVNILAAPACYEVIATFPSPLSVNGNIIISIEPFSPATDNLFIQRNTFPDGQNLNLIKIKQANQWFKNLAAGDPAFDFDFHILPLRTTAVTAGFTGSTNSGITSFINTSLNAVRFEWDFGDASISTLPAPVHSYAASGIYNVKLKAFADVLSACADSVTIPVNVVLSGISENPGNNTNITLTSNIVSSSLELKSLFYEECVITDVNGKKVVEFVMDPEVTTSVPVEKFLQGIYFISTGSGQTIKFIKTEK